jgi:hypothetical protein
MDTSSLLTYCLDLMGTFSEFIFPFNIWCDVIGSQVTGSFVLFEKRLASERYYRLLEDELPVLLKVVFSTSGDSCDCSKMAYSFILLHR